MRAIMERRAVYNSGREAGDVVRVLLVCRALLCQHLGVLSSISSLSSWLRDEEAWMLITHMPASCDFVLWRGGGLRTRGRGVGDVVCAVGFLALLYQHLSVLVFIAHGDLPLGDVHEGAWLLMKQRYVPLFHALSLHSHPLTHAQIYPISHSLVMNESWGFWKFRAWGCDKGLREGRASVSRADY